MNTIKKSEDKTAYTLKKISPPEIRSQIIGRIASEYHYIHIDSMIHDLADSLSRNNDIHAVGVVDSDNTFMGIIPRLQLQSILSQPYGRDLNKNRTVHSIMVEAKIWHYQKNIFTVASDLKKKLTQRDTCYFGLVDNKNRFAGIFSSIDLHIYLSDLTQRDIDTAKSVQACIVKNFTSSSCDIFEATGATRMARGIGGDYYNIKNYCDHKWLFSICDVSGKGVPAALLSAAIGGMERMYDFTRGFSSYLKGLNSYIFNSFEGQQFITGIYIDYDTESGVMNIFNFGHSYLYLMRGDSIREIRLKNETIPLGIKNKITPPAARFIPEKGDLLITMTDGIDEQRNPDGEELGIPRTLHCIKNNTHLNNEGIITALFKKIIDFRKNMTQNDDTTIILIRFNSQP